MNVKDKRLVDKFSKIRNLQENTKKEYMIILNEYSRFCKKSLDELLMEADEEEENGIRWKNRSVKSRLLEFRAYLYKMHAPSTAKYRFGRIQTFYRHHEIELHPLPQISTKNKEIKPMTFDDLPTKAILNQALELAKPIMRAIILFMCSSGCARRETLNLTINDFIVATADYHHQTNIYDVMDVLSKRDDVIPTFFIKRQKTNKYYFTFCSPEATFEIISYLKSLDVKLIPEMPLFNISVGQFMTYFRNIDQKLYAEEYEKINYLTYEDSERKIFKKSKFRSHVLRKWHATYLANDGMSESNVDSLQGRGRDSTHAAYFMDNPKVLKEDYIRHISAITITTDISDADVDDEEVLKIKNEIQNKEVELQKKVLEVAKIKHYLEQTRIMLSQGRIL